MWLCVEPNKKTLWINREDIAKYADINSITTYSVEEIIPYSSINQYVSIELMNYIDPKER